MIMTIEALETVKNPFVLCQVPSVSYRSDYVDKENQKGIAQVYCAEIEEGRNFTDIKVRVPACPRISKDKESRKEFESAQDPRWIKSAIRHINETGYGTLADNNNPIRWSAGGGVDMLKSDNYILMLLRDEKAPSYPLHLTTASGLSNNAGEWFYPKVTALREINEELIYSLDKDGSLLVPQQPVDELFAKKIINSAEKIGISTENPRELEYNFRGDKNSAISVYDSSNQRVSTEMMIPCYDSRTAGLDVLGIRELGYGFDDITPYDGEIFGRSVVAARKKDLNGIESGEFFDALMISPEGEKKEETMEFRATPPLEAVLGNMGLIKNYDMIGRAMNALP